MQNIPVIIVSSNSPVIIMSHSGDGYIFIMVSTAFYLTSLILNTRRNIVHTLAVDIEEYNMNELICFHAFTRRDYTSSFFREGKKLVRKQ